MPNVDSQDAKRTRDSVKWFVVAEELIPSGSLVLCAVSGGPDSMAMLSILDGLCKELEFRLAVAHFNHQLRDDAENDRTLVEAFARKLAIPFYSAEDDVLALARKTGDSLEEAARKARYGFLQGLAQEIGANRIAVGHTKDDQVETVMMRVLHGTGIRGLTGMQPGRGKIIRPMLCLERAETYQYCDAMKIACVFDPSNDDERFLRNRIRAELLPLLKTYNSGVEGNLLRLARNAQDIIKSIRDKTSPLIKQNLRRVSDDEWILNVSKLGGLDETSMFVLFGDLFAEELVCDMDFSRVHFEQLGKLTRDARASGKRLSLPGLSIKKEYENLIISKPKASARVGDGWNYSATITFPGETRAGGVVLKTEIVERQELQNAPIKSSESMAYFSLDRITLPLTLRNPVSGDRIQPFGMAGTKKLSDVFIDKKVPGRRRAKSLIIADADEILWVVGVAQCEKSRVEDTADKIVRITIEDQ